MSASLLDPPQATRDRRGRFVKGAPSANPSGRPGGFAGMAAYIRAKTQDGKELADFALGVLRNEEKCYRHSEQWDALKWLADRGFGKPVQTSIEMQGEVSTEDMPDLSSITAEQLDQLDAHVGAILNAVRTQDSE